MEQYETITCAERSRGRLTTAIILAAIGVPHLLMGLLFLIIDTGDIASRICGAVFTCSGTLLLVITAAILARWFNRKVETTADGLVFTGWLGKKTYVTWDQVSVTDHVSDGYRLEFHIPGKDISFAKSCKGYEDMRAMLRGRGLLLDKSGRRKSFRKVDEEVVEVQKLL